VIDQSQYIVGLEEFDRSTKQRYSKRASEAMPDAKSIVVIGHHMWDDMLELAIRKGEKWVYPSFFPLMVSELMVRNFLENEGYVAVPFYSSSYKRLAQLAGFGSYGKNALIVSPVFGPWVRLTTVLTNADLISAKPFEQDLCGDCKKCIDSCPTDALTPYKVDDTKCLVGVHILGNDKSRYENELKKYEPSYTVNSHLMCVEYQKACRYGKEKHTN